MNNTLYNGFKLLDFLAVSAELVSVKELAEHFQLPNSHICRLLKTLVETGYVEQDPATRKYRISLKILNLAHSRLQSERLPELARPYIRKLAEKLDVSRQSVSKWEGGQSTPDISKIVPCSKLG